MKTFTFSLLFFLCTIVSFAQNGQYDVRIRLDSIDCAQDMLCAVLELRAETAATTFNVSDINFRISFSRALDNPYIQSELTISGNVATTNPVSNTLYAAHTLTGSNDTLISYNVAYNGGDGYPLNDVDYVDVGRLCFDIIDYSVPIHFEWRTKAPVDFPHTFVGEVFNADLFIADEGSYNEYEQNNLDCTVMNTPPITQGDSVTIFAGTMTPICILNNDTDNESALDSSTVTIVAQPPASQGTVSVDPVTGCVFFTPAIGFDGLSDPIVYRVCDFGIVVPSTIGDDNPSPQSQPIPTDDPIELAPPLCTNDTLKVYVTCQDLSPILTVLPTTFTGVSTIGTVVSVTELNNRATTAPGAIVRIPADPRLTFTWDPTLTQVGFNQVQNADWTYSGTPLFHTFTHPTMIPGSTAKKFGFIGTYDPQSTDGTTTLTATVVPFSGGECKPTNNADAETIVYFD